MPEKTLRLVSDVPRGSESPLVFDAAAVSRADKVAVLVPGALARTDIFDPARAWTSRGYALVWYRFPGLDGLGLDHKLEIEDAAAQIAAFARQYPGKQMRFLGYSTGGPVAISAAEQIEGDVRVAAMSGAVECAGGQTTIFRTTLDLLAAAFSVKSVGRRPVFREYYKTLLFGRRVRRDPGLNAKAAKITQRQLDRMIYPDRELLAAHSDDLRKWRLKNRTRLAQDRLRFFIGAEDPVFSGAQTEAFARKFGQPEIRRYPGQGHLLFLTEPGVFDDVLAYFETDTN